MDRFSSCTSLSSYQELLEKNLLLDIERLKETKKACVTYPTISHSCYSSIKWPVRLVHPYFEARAAYAVPNNYYQPLLLDGEKLGNFFAHGATRSVFFIDSTLYVFSKSVNHREGEEFFTSFILAHFSKGEYSFTFEKDNFSISADTTKPMKNLITNSIEKKHITFTFQGQNVKGRMVSKERVDSSKQFSGVYGKYGGAARKSASIDLEGSAITVPHFSPHPYLLQSIEQLGFKDEEEAQLAVVEYFKEHLK